MSSGPVWAWSMAAVAAAASLLGWLALPSGERAPAIATTESVAHERAAARPPRLRIDDVEHASFADGRKALLQIDRLETRRRKVGVFTLSSFTELEIEGLRLEVGACEPKACEAEAPHGRRTDAAVIREVVEESLRDLPVGLVTRIAVDGFEVSWAGAERRIRLAAGRAALGSSDRAIALRRLVVETSEGERLVATRARWHPETGKLVVRRGYEWHRRAGQSETGGRASFRLDPLDVPNLTMLGSRSG